MVSPKQINSLWKPMPKLQLLFGNGSLFQGYFSSGLGQKYAKARYLLHSRKLTKVWRQCLMASCIPVPSSHCVRKWSVMSGEEKGISATGTPFTLNVKKNIIQKLESSLTLHREISVVCAGPHWESLPLMGSGSQIFLLTQVVRTHSIFLLVVLHTLYWYPGLLKLNYKKLLLLSPVTFLQWNHFQENKKKIKECCCLLFS